MCFIEKKRERQCGFILVFLLVIGTQSLKEDVCATGNWKIIHKETEEEMKEK